MTRLRIAAGIGLVVVLAAGVVWFLATRGPDGGGPQAAATTPITPPAPSTSASSSPTPTVISTPDLNGTDFSTIVRNMNEFRHQLYQHPDPGLVGEIYDPRCACYGRFQDELRALQGKNLRYADKGVIVVSVRVVKQVSAGSVLLDVTTRQGRQVVVDATSGAVAARGPGWPPKRAFYRFQREPDGAWRVFDFVWVDPPPPSLNL